MFNLRNLPAKESVNYPIPDSPCICDGADVYDVLCPVSKLTGVRENPLRLLQSVLPPDKVRLADAILQELPAVQSENPNISDDDALDMVVSRLSIGTPSENSVVRERLASVADVLLPKQSTEPAPATEVKSDADIVESV